MQSVGIEVTLRSISGTHERVIKSARLAADEEIVLRPCDEDWWQGIWIRCSCRRRRERLDRYSLYRSGHITRRNVRHGFKRRTVDWRDKVSPLGHLLIADLADPAPWPDTTAGGGGLASSAYAILKAFVHADDPNFAVRPLFSFREGGPGPVTNYHIVVPRAEIDRARVAARMGIGAHPELLGSMIAQKRKLLIWHNLSDHGLTPYLSINYYKQLARLNGG